MRTTLTLDDDVAKELEAEMRRRGKGMKEVVNAALRRGLRLGDKPSARRPAFVVRAHDCGGFAPGVDPKKLNQLVDELEVEDFLVREARPRPKP
jgi:hypothetical protein